MVDFGRVLTAMVTPMRDDLSVDFEAVERLVDHLIGTGTEGIVVTGTTGESPTLSTDEKIALYRAVRAAAGNRAKVIAGTGNYNTRESVELTQQAEKLGVDGCMLVVPYYNNPPQEGLYQHFRTIAESTSLPVTLYNVPSRTARNMEAVTTLRLAELPNVAAVKEASGNLDQITAILAGAPRGFLVYSGDDAMTLPMLALGAHGIISVVSHVAGNLIRQMVGAFVAGRTTEAAQLHHRLTPLFKACFATTNPIPVKAALKLIGVPVGPVRLPLVPADSPIEESLREAMRRLELLPR